MAAAAFKHLLDGSIQCPVTLSEPQDVLHRAMHPASHRRIRMVVEIVVNLAAFFVVLISLLATIIEK